MSAFDFSSDEEWDQLLSQRLVRTVTSKNKLISSKLNSILNVNGDKLIEHFDEKSNNSKPINENLIEERQTSIDCNIDTSVDDSPIRFNRRNKPNHLNTSGSDNDLEPNTDVKIPEKSIEIKIVKKTKNKKVKPKVLNPVTDELFDQLYEKYSIDRHNSNSSNSNQSSGNSKNLIELNKSTDSSFNDYDISTSTSRKLNATSKSEDSSIEIRRGTFRSNKIFSDSDSDDGKTFKNITESTRCESDTTDSDSDTWNDVINKLAIASAKKKDKRLMKNKTDLGTKINEINTNDDWESKFKKLTISKVSTKTETKATSSDKQTWQPIVDDNWLKVDSNIKFQNIVKMYRHFDERFFKCELRKNEVDIKWNRRMTTSAGLTVWNKSTLDCVIKLSQPLLSLRPRKDLIETLLHEMIHAYLFVRGERDASSHGAMFHFHMERINRLSGVKITVYHSFHDEVDLYRNRYVWRCNGVCRSLKPKYGYVRRAVNRKPGPSDTWWKKHQEVCDGEFIQLSDTERPDFLKNKA